MTEQDQITPAERRELRSVVKQQMKVLRAEVAQRQMELLAEISTRLAERYRAEDERANEFRRRVDDIAQVANDQMRDLMSEHEALFDDGRWQGSAYFQPPHVRRKSGDREDLHNAMERGIKAQARQALLDLDRQEADLLRDLAVDGLESSAARAFLGRIPSVAELVPARRLREIESEFDRKPDGMRSHDVEKPVAIAALPTDKVGHPIPWFVHRDETGVPDFRVVRRGGLEDAVRFGWCWVCGRPRGRHAAFVIGPMCAVNRVSPEPPSHLECALYSARACPFLTTPHMVRRDSRLPEGAQDPAGTMLRRNPGVALVWSSKTWTPFSVPGGVLFDVGDPTATRWLAEGRDATRDEVLASIDSGLPLLRAEAEKDGQRAVQALDEMHTAALRVVSA